MYLRLSKVLSKSIKSLKVSKLEMKVVMDSWLEQQGFPVVTVQRINGSTFRITQQSILDVKQKTMGHVFMQRNKMANYTMGGNTNSPSGNKNSSSENKISGSENKNSTIEKKNSTGGNHTPLMPLQDDSNSTFSRRSFDGQLWHIPFTFVTDKNTTETLVWVNEKGMKNLNSLFPRESLYTL